MRYNCPYPKWQDSYITLPDEWLGKHAATHDEARAKSKALTPTLQNFAIALSLLDDWQLPSVPKNLQKCNLDELPLMLIAWVNQVVFASYNTCFLVPKVLPSPLTNGATGEQITTNQAGDSQIEA